MNRIYIIYIARQKEGDRGKGKILIWELTFIRDSFIGIGLISKRCTFTHRKESSMKMKMEDSKKFLKNSGQRRKRGKLSEIARND